MPDALRTFTVRNPAVLTGREINLFGIQSHPERYQSTRFKQWLAYCKSNDRDALQSAIIEFLRGPDSVKTLDDLGNQWSSIVGAFLSYGPEINKETGYEILKQSPNAFSSAKKVAGFFAARTNVADTILALAHLKRLSLRSNIDYQSVLRVMTFVEHAAALEMRLPESTIKKHFETPVLLPSCFFRLDACKGAGLEVPFPFLQDLGVGSSERRASRNGCTSDGNCTCKVNDECIEQSYCCASITPYVVDLMIVRDSTKCYQAGDLSFIKNVLAGETLSTKHRRLDKTEEISESEEERSRYSERDLQIDDKSALHSEINSTVNTDLSIDAGVTANASWGKGTYSLTTTSNFSFDKSKETSNKETRDYSKDVMDRAISKLEEKVRTSVKTTRLIETEETNEHGFSNVEGPNVSGQYLYVNKLSRAQVYNYGKKAVVDIYLPEPASLFIKLLEGKFDGVEPAAPKKIDITAEQITPDNYSALATQYGLKDVPNPQAFHTKIEVNLEGTPGDPKGIKKKSGSWTSGFDCVIPADYVGVSMAVNSIRLNYNDGGGVSISATLGPNGDSVWHRDYDKQHKYTSSLPSIEGNHTITVHTWDVTNFTWILTIECELKAEAKAQWQKEVFAKIEQVIERETEKYQKEMEKYLDAKEAFEEKEAALKMERYNRNPFINRETERTELKRMAISYISCQFYDQFDAMKNRVKPCGFPEMDIQDAEEEGRIIQFFEQAFNWNLMTYIFYRYFWGRKCTWADKLKVESNDLIFQQFLAAGSARVLVPIRDGFFDLVQYFLATGEIWGSGGIPPLPNDPHYVSMAQEIKEQKGNYYADREGSIAVTNGSNIVTLSDTDWYWTYADLLATPPVLAGVNMLNVGADIDREIIIDCKIYRIVDIQPNPAVATPTSWLITLERNYEGDTSQKLKWSTGALFVGAPWEFVTPTTLTFLRDKSACLPCYPLKECKEDGE